MRRAVTILLILAVLAGGGYAYTRYQEQQRRNALQELQTIPAEVSSIMAMVGATGTVRANQSALLAWQTSGTVHRVYAGLGDSVQVGQVLADLEETSLPQNILMAGAELVEAQEALEELLEPASPLELRQAEQAVAKAQEAVRDAEQRLASLNSTASQTDIDQAQANLVLAQDRLDRAREAFQPYANKPESNLTRARLQSQLAQAQEEYDAAARRLNNLLGSANAIDLAVAEADLAVANAQLEEARRQYDRLKEGPEADEIAAAEARIAAARATVALKQLTAPFAGSITEARLMPGDQVSIGTAAFRLDDLSRLLVDVQVAEVDINRVRPEQNVILTFDAILGQEYHGVVREVARAGTSVQGVVEFTVTVELTDAGEAVRPGMTAAVNVVIERLENVLVVPNRAVRVRDGQRVVYVLRGGVPEPVEVVLGASSEAVSQVLEGELEAGDLVVLNPPAEFGQGEPPPFVR